MVCNSIDRVVFVADWVDTYICCDKACRRQSFYNNRIYNNRIYNKGIFARNIYQLRSLRLLWIVKGEQLGLSSL